MANWVFWSPKKKITKEWGRFFGNVFDSTMIFPDHIEKFRSSGNTVFIVPCTSLGLLSDDISKAYVRLIPTLPQLFRYAMYSMPFKDRTGRPFMPVGATVLVKISPIQSVLFCPLMFVKQDIRSTENVYFTMRLAIEHIIKYMKKGEEEVKVVMVPEMGIEDGEMKVKDSVDQQYKAWVARDVVLDVYSTNLAIAYSPTVHHMQPKASKNMNFF